MDATRLHSIMNTFTTDTVAGELLRPVMDALDKVRYPAKRFFVLSMADFMAQGVHRHLKGIRTLRAHVQMLLHLAPETVSRPPLARSTWSDALASKARLGVLKEVLPPLLAYAQTVLPDRLAAIPGLGDRPVYAIDGTYQHESAHYVRQTPRQGGEDNPKGHGLLSFFDVRLGGPKDVLVETRSRHEMALLCDYDRQEHALTREKKVLWVVIAPLSMPVLGTSRRPSWRAP